MKPFVGAHFRVWAEYYADAAIGGVAFARNDLIVAASEDGRILILEIREP